MSILHCVNVNYWEPNINKINKWKNNVFLGFHVHLTFCACELLRNKIQKLLSGLYVHLTLCKCDLRRTKNTAFARISCPSYTVWKWTRIKWVVWERKCMLKSLRSGGEMSLNACPTMTLRSSHQRRFTQHYHKNHHTQHVLSHIMQATASFLPSSDCWMVRVFHLPSSILNPGYWYYMKLQSHPLLPPKTCQYKDRGQVSGQGTSEVSPFQAVQQGSSF